MTTNLTIEQAIEDLDERLAQIGGCSDGHCVIVKPKGIHTNGGCRCWRDGMKMQRFAYAFNQFRSTVAMSEPLVTISKHERSR